MLHIHCDLAYFACDAPEEFLYLCTCLQVEHAEAEAVEGFFADLLRVVPAFEEVGIVEFVPNLIQLKGEFVGFGIYFF